MKVLGAASVLQVKDLESSLKFYCDVLGFERDFVFSNYVGVHLGDCYLHLCEHTVWARPCGGSAISVFTDEVDGYFAEIRARGATVRAEPANQQYGMRDFVISDPDGNVLTFGSPMPETPAKPPADRL